MPSLSPTLLELMSKVIDGDASYDELLGQIRATQNDATSAAIDPNSSMNQVGHVPGATVDLGRQSRCGFGEVIFGDGKSAELVAQIIQTQIDAGQRALVTRIDSGVAFQVRQSFSHTLHNPVARTLTVTPSEVPRGQPLEPLEAETTLHAAVVTAGSTDAPVAEEAIETLNWMGVRLQKFDDIGVAGPQRLAAVVPQLRLASAVVVVAGMEGALPSVVAGHLPAPVFAVPTSVGYGASLGGLTPLMGMLSTCAPSVAVVNIDGGFKGGYMAGLVVRQLQRLSEQHQQHFLGRGEQNQEMGVEPQREELEA
jgi:NCAIR mutase (PurE)-related protein